MSFVELLQEVDLAREDSPTEAFAKLLNDAGARESLIEALGRGLPKPVSPAASIATPLQTGIIEVMAALSENRQSHRRMCTALKGALKAGMCLRKEQDELAADLIKTKMDLAESLEKKDNLQQSNRKLRRMSMGLPQAPAAPSGADLAPPVSAARSLAPVAEERVEALPDPLLVGRLAAQRKVLRTLSDTCASLVRTVAQERRVSAAVQTRIRGDAASANARRRQAETDLAGLEVKRKYQVAELDAASVAQRTRDDAHAGQIRRALDALRSFTMGLQVLVQRSSTLAKRAADRESTWELVGKRLAHAGEAHAGIKGRTEALLKAMLQLGASSSSQAAAARDRIARLEARCASSQAYIAATRQARESLRRRHVEMAAHLRAQDERVHGLLEEVVEIRELQDVAQEPKPKQDERVVRLVALLAERVGASQEARRRDLQRVHRLCAAQVSQRARLEQTQAAEQTRSAEQAAAAARTTAEQARLLSSREEMDARLAASEERRRTQARAFAATLRQGASLQKRTAQCIAQLGDQAGRARTAGELRLAEMVRRNQSLLNSVHASVVRQHDVTRHLHGALGRLQARLARHSEAAAAQAEQQGRLREALSWRLAMGNVSQRSAAKHVRTLLAAGRRKDGALEEQRRRQALCAALIDRLAAALALQRSRAARERAACTGRHARLAALSAALRTRLEESTVAHRRLLGRQQEQCMAVRSQRAAQTTRLAALVAQAARHAQQAARAGAETRRQMRSRYVETVRRHGAAIAVLRSRLQVIRGGFGGRGARTHAALARASAQVDRLRRAGAALQQQAASDRACRSTAAQQARAALQAGREQLLVIKAQCGARVGAEGARDRVLAQAAGRMRGEMARLQGTQAELKRASARVHADVLDGCRSREALVGTALARLGTGLEAVRAASASQRAALAARARSSALRQAATPQRAPALLRGLASRVGRAHAPMAEMLGRVRRLQAQALQSAGQQQDLVAEYRGRMRMVAVLAARLQAGLAMHGAAVPCPPAVDGGRREQAARFAARDVQIRARLQAALAGLKACPRHTGAPADQPGSTARGRLAAELGDRSRVLRGRVAAVLATAKTLPAAVAADHTAADAAHARLEQELGARLEQEFSERLERELGERLERELGARRKERLCTQLEEEPSVQLKEEPNVQLKEEPGARVEQEYGARLKQELGTRLVQMGRLVATGQQQLAAAKAARQPRTQPGKEPTRAEPQLAETTRAYGTIKAELRARLAQTLELGSAAGAELAALREARAAGRSAARNGCAERLGGLQPRMQALVQRLSEALAAESRARAGAAAGLAQAREQCAAGQHRIAQLESTVAAKNTAIASLEAEPRGTAVRVVEKLVEKPVYVEKPVPTPIHVDRIVERVVEKPIYVDRIVEQAVLVERRVQTQDPLLPKRVAYVVEQLLARYRAQQAEVQRLCAAQARAGTEVPERGAAAEGATHDSTTAQVQRVLAGLAADLAATQEELYAALTVIRAQTRERQQHSREAAAAELQAMRRLNTLAARR